MPETALIANLGVSDLNYRDSRVVSDDNSILPGKTFRNRTKHIKDNFDEYKHDLSLPLLPPLIHYVSKETGRLPHRFIFIATDQSLSNPARTGKDTCHLARVIEKIFRLWYPDIETLILTYETDPTDYDLTSVWMHGIVENVLSSDSAVFAGLTGGTPALNTGLIYGLSLTDKPCSTMLYVFELPQEELLDCVYRNMRYPQRK